MQRQLAQALFKLSVEFRKEETRFLNKMEAQKGLAAGSSIGLIEEEGGGGGAFADPGFTETQLMKVLRGCGWLQLVGGDEVDRLMPGGGAVMWRCAGSAAAACGLKGAACGNGQWAVLQIWEEHN